MHFLPLLEALPIPDSHHGASCCWSEKFNDFWKLSVTMRQTLPFVSQLTSSTQRAGTLFFTFSLTAAAKLLQSCLTLHDPMDGSLPGSSVHAILYARLLEWVAMPSSRGSSQPRDRTQVFCIAGRFFTAEPPGKPYLLLYAQAISFKKKLCLPKRLVEAILVSMVLLLKNLESAQ